MLFRSHGKCGEPTRRLNQNSRRSFKVNYLVSILFRPSVRITGTGGPQSTRTRTLLCPNADALCIRHEKKLTVTSKPHWSHVYRVKPECTLHRRLRRLHWESNSTDSPIFSAAKTRASVKLRTLFSAALTRVRVELSAVSRG